MDIYLIRHAEAKPRDEDGVERDEERPLTETGEAQSRELAAGLQRRGVELHLLLSSPLVRAKQTAEAMRKQWSLPVPELQLCDDLAPGLRPRKLAKLLRDLKGQAVGLVGHMPDLAELACWLIGGKKAQIDLAKAGVARISCTKGPRKGEGILVWLVTPEWMSK